MSSLILIISIIIKVNIDVRVCLQNILTKKVLLNGDEYMTYFNYDVYSLKLFYY